MFSQFSLLDQVLDGPESGESDETWNPGSNDTVSDSTDGLASSGMSSTEEAPLKVDSTHHMPTQETKGTEPDRPKKHMEKPNHSRYDKKPSHKRNVTNFSMLSKLRILILAVTVLGIITLWLVWPDASIVRSDRKSVSRLSTDDFVVNLRELRQSFPSQTDRFWKTILARSKRHISSVPPKRPLVFMTAADPETSRTSQCLAHHISQALSASRPLLINGSMYADENGDQVKLKLDKMLKKYFDVAPAGTTVIDHIELLPPSSPFLFYSYCDNDNALYPYATVIFIAHVRTKLNAADPVGAEKAVEQFLGKDVWGSNPPYDPGAVAALLSRITDTVLVPRLESSDRC